MKMNPRDAERLVKEYDEQSDYWETVDAIQWAEESRNMIVELLKDRDRLFKAHSKEMNER